MTTVRDDILRYADEVGSGNVFTFEDATGACKKGASRNTIAKAFGRLVANGELNRIARGLYAKPIVYEGIDFGGTFDHTQAMFKLWMGTPGERVYGYASGPSVAAEMGFQTQIPADIDIHTNEWRKHTALAKRLKVRLHKPRTEVTEENWKELQLLDALVDRRAFDCGNLTRLVKQAIDRGGLDAGMLVSLAGEHYSDETLNLIARSLYAA